MSTLLIIFLTSIITEEFMAEFRHNFFDFDTIDDHIKHLAYLGVRQDVGYDYFIEGYGPSNEMGLKVTEVDSDITIDCAIPDEDDED